MDHVCPWWFGHLLAHRARKLFQDPAEIVSPYVSEGMSVLEPGPGMGFFTVELARRVGAHGKVYCVDLQQKMLDGVRAKASTLGLADRLVLRRVTPDSLEVGDLGGAIDFALVFWMLHEVPDRRHFLSEIAGTLGPRGRVLFVEPKGHVSGRAFDESVSLAEGLGLRVESRARVRLSRAVLLVKG